MLFIMNHCSRGRKQCMQHNSYLRPFALYSMLDRFRQVFPLVREKKMKKIKFTCWLLLEIETYFQTILVMGGGRQNFPFHPPPSTSHRIALTIKQHSVYQVHREISNKQYSVEYVKRNKHNNQKIFFALGFILRSIINLCHVKTKAVSCRKCLFIFVVF